VQIGGLFSGLVSCHTELGSAGHVGAMRTFIKKLGKDTVFDPEDVTILVGAFDTAWKSVQASGSEYSAERFATQAREILAKHIIDAAEHGERDQRQLAAGALLKLSHSNLKFPSK